MNNISKFKEFRTKYPVFEYLGYSFVVSENKLKVTYEFSIPNLTTFYPTWEFNLNDVDMKTIDGEILEMLIFNLGLVEVISYWKTVCSPIIRVCGKLENMQIKWWKKLWYKGLGEFLYTNGIYNNLKVQTNELLFEENPVITVESIDNSKEFSKAMKNNNIIFGNLIPVGGGKDSIVTMELMKPYFALNTAYIINPREASMGTACIAGYEKKIYTPSRNLDGQLLELNQKGFLNGHTPFSAVVAFSSYISAYLLHKEYIVLSNETSANEGNVKDTDINHQYSKSIQFENDFIAYATKYMLKDGPKYFSLLRPFTEWQIVKQFAKYIQYFHIFKSCNVGSKEDVWCENCPKCLYIYIMLLSNISPEEIDKIFRSDMLQNEKLKETYAGLINPDLDKPFECVGTKEEINIALNGIYRRLEKKLPMLMNNFQPLKEEEYIQLIKKYSKTFERNNVPNEYIELLKEMR